jgi:hypothetical protein
MMLLGYRARYTGPFNNVPVIQAGAYKLIQVKDYPSVPITIMMLLIQARNAGADFLVIDNEVKGNRQAQWIDVREAA